MDTESVKIPSDYFIYGSLGVFLLVPILCYERSPVAYQLRWLFLYFAICAISFAMSPFMLLLSPSKRSPSHFSHFAKLLFSCFGLTIELRNSEIVAMKRGGFLVANHQHAIDFLAFLAIWNKCHQMVGVAKKSLMYTGPVGFTFWLLGTAFIDRSRTANSYQIMHKLSKLTLGEKKAKIFMFPEGTRNKKVNETRKLLPFKQGAFKLAIECQVPIIPIVMSPYYFVNPNINYFGPGTLILQPLPIIETQGMTEKDIPELIAKTRQIMQDTYHKLWDEVSQKLPKTHPFFFKQ